MGKKYVERFNTAERVLHWFVAASFFTLLLSGLGLYSRLFHGYFDLFGGGRGRSWPTSTRGRSSSSVP